MSPTEQGPSLITTAWYCLNWSSKDQTVQLALLKLTQEAQDWHFQFSGLYQVATFSTSLALRRIPPDFNVVTYASASSTCYLAKMDSSMAPPHFLGSRIHFRYSALLLPKNPSLYVKGSAATASAIILLHTSCIVGIHQPKTHAL